MDGDEFEDSWNATPGRSLSSSVSGSAAMSNSREKKKKKQQRRERERLLSGGGGRRKEYRVFNAGWAFSGSEVSEAGNDVEEAAPRNLNDVTGDSGVTIELNPVVATVSNAKRFVLMICAVFFSLMLSGVVFGWPAVVIMLQEQGVYEYLCQPGVALPCQAQVNRFNLVFVVASTGFACAVLPMGIILDRWGPKVCAAMGNVLLIAGSVMFAFSDPPRFDGFLPGYLLIALGGPPVVFSCMHLANLFPEKKGLIITMLNVALDASSLVFVILRDVYSLAPAALPYKVMFLGFAAVPTVSLLVGLVLWPRHAYTAEVAHVAEVEGDSEVPFKAQVTSLVFWLCAVFTTLNLFRVNYYIATVNGQLLEFTGDTVRLGNSTVTENQLRADLFTSIFTYFLPVVGVLSVPVIGLLLDRVGLYLSIWCLVASGILYGIFSLLLFLPIEVQLITFIFVAFFRALLFSAMATYVSAAFSFQHFGKLWGIVFLMGGLVNLAEYFLSAAVEGNFFWLNVGMLVVSILMIVFPVYLHKNPPPQTVVSVH